MLQISVTKSGPASVVQVTGRIDATTAPAFEEKCREVISGGERVVVLDFSGLQYISSAGLRSVLLLAKILKESEGSLRLANLGGIVAQVFELSGFSSVFPIYDSVEKALASSATA